MDKVGARKCISNIALTLKELLHNIEKDLVSKYSVNIKLVENNAKSIKKLLDLDKNEEDEDEA